MTVINELLKSRPDLVKVRRLACCSAGRQVAARARKILAAVQALMQPVPTDRKGEIPAGKGPTYLMPIVHVHRGLLTVNYGEQLHWPSGLQVCWLHPACRVQT